MRLLFTAMMFAVAVGITGCVGLPSGTLPPRLSSSESARVKSAHFAFTIGIEQHDASSDLLITKLRQTKLFDSVDYVDRLPNPPAIVAEFVSTPYGTATIPFPALLTFGIIPSSSDEPLSIGCSFHSLHHPERKVQAVYQYESRTTLGWVSLFLALSPDVVMTSPDSHRRFIDRFTLAILDHSDEIIRMSKE